MHSHDSTLKHPYRRFSTNRKHTALQHPVATLQYPQRKPTFPLPEPCKPFIEPQKRQKLDTHTHTHRATPGFACLGQVSPRRHPQSKDFRIVAETLSSMFTRHGLKVLCVRRCKGFLLGFGVYGPLDFAGQRHLFGIYVEEGQGGRGFRATEWQSEERGTRQTVDSAPRIERLGCSNNISKSIQEALLLHETIAGQLDFRSSQLGSIGVHRLEGSQNKQDSCQFGLPCALP